MEWEDGCKALSASDRKRLATLQKESERLEERLLSPATLDGDAFTEVCRRMHNVNRKIAILMGDPIPTLGTTEGIPGSRTIPY
jgi:hypothetical protein